MSSSEEWLQRYKFCQPIGQGGMGTIYLAEDKANNNAKCVIKQLTNKDDNDIEQSEAVRLFQREAQILNNLHHPGIVRVFDYHAAEYGRYFLVMDYVAGKDLDALVKETGPLSSDTVINLAIQCCEVLEYLHSQDPPVIYRDLKPSNLILTPDGRIVFVDFGIARLFIPKVEATRVVTAGYSPPEQYFGKPETRSDLYSLGATISHLLTGMRPKPLALCTPGLINSHVLLSVDCLVRKLTAYNVDDRLPNAQTVRWELYRSYKELHPDFEVPKEPGVSTNYIDLVESTKQQELAASNQTINIYSLARFRASSYNVYKANKSEGKKTEECFQKANTILRTKSGTSNFLCGIKKWLKNWMS